MAVAEGLDRKNAKDLISSMVRGTGDLVFNSNHSIADLKGQITSPGVTTIRDILALEKGSL